MVTHDLLARELLEDEVAELVAGAEVATICWSLIMA